MHHTRAGGVTVPQMAATSRDVAQRAGVSQPTVSRALRDDPRVADATKEKVRRAAADLGYVPSEAGRSLATSSTHQIAVVADLRNALYPVLVEPLHDTFEAHGYRMVLIAERGDGKTVSDRLLDRSVDGVILTTSRLRSPLSAVLSKRRVPFVELNRTSGRRGVTAVVADNHGGARAVAHLLAELGHRRVGAVMGTRLVSTSRDREAGLRQGLADHGIDLNLDLVVHGGFGHEAGQHGFDHLMSTRNPPSAVFCIGDSAAVGALNQARRMGISVPGDVTVVGFDNLHVAGWPAFDLTTVDAQIPALAVAAGERLVTLLAGDDAQPSITTVPTALVLRGTHAPPCPTPSDRTRKAS